ncbi:hypothetical protein Tco_0600305 [Tanacetum coccineum]|uniref:Uncharacterized protein n=1 Tax=Tanacetum coccineum TaxID=301880 RepID=A0ABQ4WBB2_9ASTR
MAESSSHNTSSPEIIPKGEPVTLDKPESPNPFLPVTQVEFTFEEITFTTNNETLEDSKVWVSTPTGGVRGDIGDWGQKRTLKKSCLPPRWRLLMGQIIQYLGGKTGGLDQISNKDATILYCLANGVHVDYAKLIWEDLIHKLNKKTREKIVPYPRFISLLHEHMMPEYDNEELTINPTRVFSVHNWTLKPNQHEEPPFITHMKAICKLYVHVVSKAPKPSSQTEETEASKSKTGQSETKTKSSSTKDKNPSHPSPLTLVVGEMHKETHQTAGGLTSLGATSEEGAHPQLSAFNSY